MKTGELIILWIAGLLSVAWLLLALPELPAPSRGALSPAVGLVLGRALRLVGVLVMIWTIAGLIWLTIYKRKARQ